MAVPPKRFGRYGLTLHPEKTRLVAFQSPARFPPRESSRKPGTFDLLGFTHYWARSRRRTWVVKQKTARGRLCRALRRVRQWCRTHRHWPVAEQHQMFVAKLRGHYGYYGITGNTMALAHFYHEVRRARRKWLGRRSQKSGMSWERFKCLLERHPLPQATPVHSAHRRAANP